jgi:opacity protein-like surface antigen
MKFFVISASLALALTAAAAAAQTASPAQNTAPAEAQSTSQNLLPGANSPSESAALAYMKTAMRSEFLYNKKHQKYARTLMDLVGSGSFTRRMARPNRGDYTVHYSSNGEKYELTMVPMNFDDQHRSFFVDQDEKIRVDAQQPANAQSPRLDTKKK